MVNPSSIFLTDRSKVVPLLWSLFVIYVSCLSFLCCLVCSLQPCDHLLGKGGLLGSLLGWGLLCFGTFPYGVPGQVRYLIVSTSDLCLPLLCQYITARLSVQCALALVLQIFCVIVFAQSKEGLREYYGIL